MKNLAIISVLAMLTAGCMPDFERQSIVVDGEGVVMAKPDAFQIRAEIRANGNNQGEALEEMSATLNRVTERLPLLEGLETAEMVTSAAGVGRIYESECIKGAPYQQLELCPVEGQFARTSIDITGTPASAAGDALSYLSEIGASDVILIGYVLTDRDRAKADATETALKNARERAQRLADAAGATLGEPLRIQYGDGFGDDLNGSRYVQQRMIRVSAPLADDAAADRSPVGVKLTLSPRPIEVREEVTVAYSIEN